MQKKLQQKYHLAIPRKVVAELLREIDPVGVVHRSYSRLVRRSYVSPGPDFTWHVDGYDKLKPYGFAVSGCIDGFSRRILWLEVANTNNDPDVIASYYWECLKAFGKFPRHLRTDCGTENRMIATMHTMLCHQIDGHNGSHIFGKSTGI